MPKTQLITSILLLFFCCACTRQNKESNLPTTAATPASGHPRNSVDVVKAIASPAELRLNGSADAVVRVTVQNGYHINANPSTFSYLIATELTMNPTAGISVSFIVYPDAITKSFSFADKPLAVYQGTTDIKVRLKADKSSPVGTQNLSAKLRVQACDDQVCYAPGTLDVTIPVSIK